VDRQDRGNHGVRSRDQITIVERGAAWLRQIEGPVFVGTAFLTPVSLRAKAGRNFNRDAVESCQVKWGEQ
jgi:hypothetical protein